MINTFERVNSNAILIGLYEDTFVKVAKLL